MAVVLLEQFLVVLGQNLRKPLATIAPAQGSCEGRMDEDDRRFRAFKAAYKSPERYERKIAQLHGIKVTNAGK
jgi:hypothetical protein